MAVYELLLMSWIERQADLVLRLLGGVQIDLRLKIEKIVLFSN